MLQLTDEQIEQWSNRIYEAINDISDFEFQQRTWNGLDPNVISSYSEIVCVLFDDNAFEEYITEYKERNGDSALYKLMEELSQMISAYNPPDTMSDKTILIDPEWIAICYKAKEVCECWKAHNIYP